MTPTPPIAVETDPRFPSGPWSGFFLQREIPGRHRMELHLTFTGGRLTGEGRDWVGKFVLRGHYDVPSGKCYWSKRYLGKHDVFYSGYNEGKGIWGVWEIRVPRLRGGFYIWPEGMADPTGHELHEEADLPAVVEDALELSEPLAVPL